MLQLDELVDMLVQPQQDQQLKVEVDGKLMDFEPLPKHESGYFVFKVKREN
jgi:hypothetical protein